MAAEAFTDQLCQSGEYGDRWRYIAAWHTDRPHPHMHVVIDRLGASGRMMQIHPAKTINPKALRALQVDTAIEYGIALNDTPRVSRGHRDCGLSSPEWRAEQRGESRDRSPTRQVYAKTASSFAEDAIGREANELKKLSERYQRADTPERRQEAKSLERAAFILSSGGTLDDAPRETSKMHRPKKLCEAEERQQEGSERYAVRETPIRRRYDVSKDVTADEFAGLVSRMRVDGKDHSETEPKPASLPRRMTEAELRAHLAGEERKITEQQRRAQDRSKITLDDLSSEPEEPYPSIEGPVNESDQAAYLPLRPQLGRDRQDETRQPKRLTEQELREVLIKREREMTAAERDRQRDATIKSKDSGMDFGFD